MARTTLLIWTLVLGLVSLSGGSGVPLASGAEATPAQQKALATILAGHLRNHVTVLASDAYGGRETLHPGATMARDYLEARFLEAGLSRFPGQESLAIPYTLHSSGFDRDGTTLSITTGDSEMSHEGGRDFIPFAFSGVGTIEGDVAFAGYGITSDESHWDDYAGLDVEGKIVLILRHTPHENDPKHPLTGSQASYFASKAQNAQAHGAVAMLLVTDPRHHANADDLRYPDQLRLRPNPQRRVRPGQNQPFLSLHISRETAESVMRSSGKTLLEAQKAVDSGTPAARIALSGVRARATVKRAESSQEVTAHNVLGIIEGSDPVLKKQWVVVGAHYDHIGGYAGEGDTTFNGADDNASGTSALLELVQAFGGREQAPARSIAFIGFSGEEKGLLGSKAFVDSELIDAEDIVFMYNIDMIGRNSEKPVEVTGDGFATGLKELVESSRGSLDLELEYAGRRYAGNSDHDPFYRRSIPFLFLFTGLHKDYHQLGDHADKLGYERMEKITRLAYRIIDGVASAAFTPRFIHHVGWLGIEVQVKGEGQTERAVITDVEADSRGAKAGLRAGDVVRRVGAVTMEEAGQVGAAFGSLTPGSEEILVILRGGEKHEITVKRSRVGFIGIVPGMVDEERRKKHGLAAEEGVAIAGVAPNGPAGPAGVQAGDILIRIAGAPVNPMTLRRQLTRIGAGETVELTLVRDGERIRIELTLAERPSR